MARIVVAGLSRTFQPAILLLGQIEPDSTPAHVDGALQRLAAFEIQLVAAALRDFKQLLLSYKIQADRNRRLQVLLEKLAMPAALGLKRHVDATRRFPLPGTAGAELFTRLVRRRQRYPAQGTYLAGETHA